MKKAVLDTNFVIAAVENRVDVVTQLAELLETPVALLIPEQCFNELKSLGARKVFSLAEKYLLSARVEVARTKKRKADDAVLELALREGGVACTRDSALRRKLKKAGIQVITLRDKTRLVFA